MKCTVEEFYMNVRFRVLNIENEQYILDMGGTSLWRLLFPFFYWLFPLRAYKVDEVKVLNELTSPSKRQQGGVGYALLGGVIAVMLGNLIYPLIQYLDITITSVTSALIISVVFLLIIAFYLYANRLLGRKLHHDIQLEKYAEKKVWVRPKSKQYVVQLLFYYLFVLGLCIGFVTAVIQYPNGVMFFISSMFLFLMFLVGFATVRSGETTVQFKTEARK